MNLFHYIKEALLPGGTPQRYLYWVIIVLLCQTFFSVHPSPFLHEPFPHTTHLLVLGVLIAVVISLTVQQKRQQIIAAYLLYLVGLTFSAISISTGITSLSGIIFMLTWAMTLFVAERREYLTFDWVTVFMVFMLLATVVILLNNPSFDVENNLHILTAGALLTGINIFLVYIDFDAEKNFYQVYRATYANLEQLSLKMSEILVMDASLEHILKLVSQECIPLLELEDCVIYLFDEEKQRLIQVAAFGQKLDEQNSIVNPISIQPGDGVVGKCYQEGKPILVEELRYFPGYIVDDKSRNAELAVPIMSNGKVVGVIDSEHSQKGYFKDRHVQAFNIIASFCGVKITEEQSKRSMVAAELAKEEAERFMDLDQLKQRFITNISHDLKTPLALIKGPANEILAEAQDKRIQSLATFIKKNADHLLRVVNQLLQLNRTTEGLNELYLEEIHLKDFMQKVAEQYQGLAEQKEIAFSIDLEDMLLVTDAFRFEQVMHNLIHNAFRYTPSGESIQLLVRKVEDRCQVVVADTGPGIEPSLQSKIFDRFFKVDVNNHEGTGIGLSLVKEYVQSLKGTISLESTPGEGSTFTIRLPLFTAPEINEEAASPLTQLEPDEVKPILLVVEDHPDLNNFIASVFEHEFHCLSAFDGEEALRLMKQVIPDVIISDLMMPKVSGLKMIERIKADDVLAHIPVVILTAKDQLDSKVELYQKGVENYLTKPFDMQELRAVVYNVLSKRRSLMESFLKDLHAPSSLPPEVPNTGEEEYEGLVYRLVAYVKENMTNDQLNISYCCKDLGIGRNRLQREVKEVTGLTPVEFVRSLRLEEAKQRLSDPRWTVSEVAYAVGFNNLSYFSRSFKTEFGVLPSEYREKVVRSV